MAPTMGALSNWTLSISSMCLCRCVVKELYATFAHGPAGIVIVKSIGAEPNVPMDGQGVTCMLRPAICILGS